MNFILRTVLIAALALLAGCGNKGPLVLPTPPAPIDPATVPEAPAEPAPAETTPAEPREPSEDSTTTPPTEVPTEVPVETPTTDGDGNG